MPQEIQNKLIEEEMKTNYIDYAMSVITARALPDVRDGLKPVHRRILYTMERAGLFSNKQFRKSAFVVGRTLSDAHPHGDTSVYDALVRMAQDFSLRYPLVQGQGNMGSVDGDAPAAQRYTECKLSKFGEELLYDLDKETVNFIPNYDNSLKEPVVLPSKIPNLLINGSSGIAVGMATNIPPHNINEVINAVNLVIDNKEVNVMELINHVLGPDFPTGGIISGKQGIIEAYKTGRGKIIIKAKTKIEPRKIIVEEIPYQVNKTLLIENIADLVKEKKIEGISDIRDESDRKGMRLVIELKRDANPEIVLNQLYSHTQLQTTFGIIMLALDENKPKIMNLKDLINSFIKHRFNVITNRTKFDLNKAEKRAHILEGLLIALDHLDEVISTIRKSKDKEESDFKESLKLIENMTDDSLAQIQSDVDEFLKEDEKIEDDAMEKGNYSKEEKLFEKQNKIHKFYKYSGD